MGIDGDTLRAWIEGELASVSDERVTSHVRRLLVEPSVALLLWSYGEPGQRYPCWTVLDDAPHSSTVIVYCAQGFGPRCPWGLVRSGIEVDDGQVSMGMDSGWFPTFMDAFLDSIAANALPIWCVFKELSDGAKAPVSEENDWAATWKQRDAIQDNDPSSRYHVGHGIMT